MLSFRMVYQPLFQYDNIVSVEALLRPNEANHTIDDVIESFSSKVFFDLAVFRKVIKDVRSNRYITEVNVNIHPSSLLSFDFIQECVTMSVSVSTIITLELVEYENHNFDSLTLLHVCYLRTFGIKIAIDDFGSDFCGVDALINIPVDKVKIDGSLVKGIESNQIKLKLLRIVNSMLVDLVDPEIVFECAENKMQVEIIKRINASSTIQGYYYEQPLELYELRNKYCNKFTKIKKTSATTQTLCLENGFPYN